jgi:hypothetical protein
MRNIAFGALLAGLLVACGGNKSNKPDAVVSIIDASIDGGGGACDPVAQTGCMTGQKCSWVRIAASASSQVGTLACVQDGTVALNGACTWGAAGSSTGYDNCTKGLICLASSRKDMATGTCSTICDTTALSGAAGACPTNYACGKYVNFFSNTGDPSNNIGLCDPTCDPLAQTRDYDSAAHCGGPLDTNNQPTRECNGPPGGGGQPSQFTCTSVLDPTKIGGSFAYDATLGGYFLNSCAAGFMPLLYDSTADAGMDMKVICVGFCQPADTSIESHPNPGGVAPNTCAAKGTGGTHECKYWWTLEFDQSGNPGKYTKWSNGLGYCFDYTQYTYDGTMYHPPTSAMTPEPACATLSSVNSTINPTANGGTQTDPDAMFFGCMAEPPSFTGGTAPRTVHSPLQPLLGDHQMKQIVDSWK